MGGAMDLVAGVTRRVVVAMQHCARGASKIVPACTLPLTAVRRVDLIVTDLAVIRPGEDGLTLIERAPGVSTEAVIAATAARVVFGSCVSSRSAGSRLGAARGAMPPGGNPRQRGAGDRDPRSCGPGASPRQRNAEPPCLSCLASTPTGQV
jgi:hypothetical protein